MSSQRIVTVTEVRRKFGAIVKRLGKRDEHAIIQSSGMPVAVLLSMAEYEQLVAHKKRKAAFHDFARHLGQEVEARGMTEEEFAAQLEQTKRQVFAEQYDRSAQGLQDK